MFAELHEVPPSTAWKLIDPLFNQVGAIVAGAAMFIAVGLIGFTATRSPWYLAGIGASAAGGIWRLQQILSYRRHRDSVAPVEWARRALRSAWLTGAIWGAWSFVVPFETDRYFDFMLIGVQITCVAGGAVRNNSVPAVAIGQALLALIPPFFICATSSSRYMNVFTPFTVLNFFAAVSLVKFLHGQTLRLLLMDEEKNTLVNRLELANQELAILNRHLSTLAATDALTGLANRRAFDLALSREWRAHTREERPLSLLLLDVDNFKKYNDTYGHPAGDQCLRVVAEAIVEALRRPGDSVSRYGGEEFAVILPGTDAVGALTVADQVRSNVRARGLAHSASPFSFVTVSIGVATVMPQPDQDSQLLTDQADAALYSAKRLGRNRAHHFETVTLAAVPS
jgi:diguanylate cyclase (GGDEF)-like protein